jgi:CheY-like chemotaxis protein
MNEQAVILLVDDDSNDGTLIQRVFFRAKVLNPLVFLKSGEEAIDYLSGLGKYTNRAEYPLPALILLDIKMHGIDGLEVLRWIRTQPGLGTIRVVMLTSSDDTKDVNAAYQLGANSFLTKPVDFERFLQVAQALSGYWLWMDKAPESFRPAASKPADSRTSKPQPESGL